MTDHTHTLNKFDEAVATLDQDLFIDAANLIAMKIRNGNGIHLHFEPGDATKYLFSAEPRIIEVVSTHPRANSVNSIPSTRITFGTESNHTTTYIGHGDMSTLHPFTQAVWRRLWAITSPLLYAP